MHEGKTVLFTKGKPFWTKNVVIYKLYLTSPKEMFFYSYLPFLFESDDTYGRKQKYFFP